MVRKVVMAAVNSSPRARQKTLPLASAAGPANIWPRHSVVRMNVAPPATNACVSLKRLRQSRKQSLPQSQRRRRPKRLPRQRQGQNQNPKRLPSQPRKQRARPSGNRARRALPSKFTPPLGERVIHRVWICPIRIGLRSQCCGAAEDMHHAACECQVDQTEDDRRNDKRR